MVNQFGTMQTIRTVSSMQQQAIRWRRAGVKIGFVPTMGCLHPGHLSLIRRARQAVGPQGKVVVSIYVNPTQFGRGEDFSRYPRPLKDDLRLCRQTGADAVFTPSDASMYPGMAADGFSTYVVEERLTQCMEGAARPGHFRGVTTIVAKLFNCVLPDVAVFGAKDWQQAAVIKRMVADLNFPLRILVAPTLREPDGLAMSSRNKYLDPAERQQATILFRAMSEARRAVKRAPQSAARLKKQLARLIAIHPAARLDYIEFFNGTTLQPEKTVRPGSHMALAAFIGKTRLIDNSSL
jgi:pantoate--beta-alanine ligase